MKKLIFVVLYLLTLTPNAIALEEKVIDGIIVHENSNPTLIDNFVEDVLSLLPPDMYQSLEPHREALLREARFNVSGGYWRRKVIGMNEFKGQLESISIKDRSELASQLGRSVENIFEIAMRPNDDDMMNEGLERNLKDVLKRWKNEKYVVNYHGYKGQSVDVILASIYEMKKYSKTNLYPDLVATTADLWSAIWQRGGGKTQLVAKTFVRKPVHLEFKKATAPIKSVPRWW
jgi:hypothetical protein